MPTTESLWPEFEEATIVSPVSILREQGKYLEDKTKGLLNTSISTSKDFNENLIHRFKIRVPSLGGLAIELLKIEHGIFNVYPLMVSFDNRTYKAENEDEFMRILEGIFKDQKTLGAVNVLLAQIKEVEDDELPF